MINQLIINTFISIAVYLLIATSFAIIYNPLKYFHMTHALFITFGAYFTYLFSQRLNLSAWISIPLSIILCVVLSLLMAIIIYKPLYKKNTSNFLVLVASLGLYTVCQNCISIFFGDDTKSLRTGDIQIGNKFFSAYITDIQMITIIVSISLFIIILLFLKFTKPGRNNRAVASNSELANISGINSNKVILISFGIGSGLASIVGILVAYDTGMTPTMGLNLLLYGIVVMIIGGVGSVWGLLGGAFFLAFAQNLTSNFLDSKWMDASAYIILILFLVWKPLGLGGQKMKKVEI
jgi:branched-subunit amino acid ABC-type transport system permease component